jgi:DNA-binding CsgD family transcriptional regulator
MNELWDLLTEREHEAVEALIEEGTYRAAANRLGIAEQTVKNHMYAVRKKVGAKNSLQAVYKLVTGG